MFNIKKYTFIVSILFLLPYLHGEEVHLPDNGKNIKNSYSIDELVSRSLKNYELLKEARKKINRYRHARDQAGTWENPMISASAGYKKDTSSGYLYGLTLSQSIPWPGKRNSLKAMIQKEQDMARLDHEEMKLYVRHEVTRLAFRYSALKAMESHAGARLKRLRLVETFLRNRKILSPDKIVERNIIQGRVRILEKNMAETRQRARQALTDLNLFTCFCLPSNDFPTISLDWYRTIPPVSLDSLKTAALKKNFQIRQADIIIAREKKKINFARKKSNPDLTVSLFFNEENTGTPERSIGGGISLPLPLLNRNRGEIRQGQTDLAIARLKSQYLQRRLGRRLENLLAHYETTSLLLKKFSLKSMEAVKGETGYAYREFIRGRVSLANYLDMDEQANEIIEAVYDTQLRIVTLYTTLKFLAGEQ